MNRHHSHIHLIKLVGIQIRVRRAASRGYSYFHLYVILYVCIYLFIYLCHVLRVTFMLFHTGCFILKIHVRQAASQGYSYFHLCVILYVCIYLFMSRASSYFYAVSYRVFYFQNPREASSRSRIFLFSLVFNCVCMYLFICLTRFVLLLCSFIQGVLFSKST